MQVGYGYGEGEVDYNTTLRGTSFPSWSRDSLGKYPALVCCRWPSAVATLLRHEAVVRRCRDASELSMVLGPPSLSPRTSRTYCSQRTIIIDLIHGSNGRPRRVVLSNGREISHDYEVSIHTSVATPSQYFLPLPATCHLHFPGA